MNPAVIYTRFSPRPVKRRDGKQCTADERDAEIEKIQSLNTQVDACTRYCGVKELTVVEVVRDPLMSARSVQLKYRPGGQRLLELIADGSVKHIVVQKIDRLFRDVEERGWLKKWKRAGVTLHLADQGGCSIDCSTATGMMFFTMMMTFAEFEPAMTAERTSGAMKHHQEGGRAMSKQPPYGKRIENGRLVDDPLEQDIVEYVLRWHESGAPATTIARFLETNGRPTRSGTPWRHSTVQRIINRYGKK